ncbi:hypothetical protein ACFWXK_33265, partial [Streptomyces sp. NPDC059070]
SSWPTPCAGAGAPPPPGGGPAAVGRCGPPHDTTVLDHLSSQRRPLKDQLGLQRQLISQVNQGPVPFGELVERTSLPVVARAHATHLLWHRRLAVDLGRPLGDGSLVWLGQRRL